METLPRPDFQSKGDRACALIPNVNIFFAEMDMPRTNESKILTAQAKEVCEECPYKKSCAAYAIDHPNERGVWGGLSEEDRREIRKKMEAGSKKRQVSA